MHRWMDCSRETPPLEALRFLIHEAATVRAHEPLGSKVLMIYDVSRACFEAPAIRNVRVEIPAEDRDEGDRKHDRVGNLRMRLYGTRDAAMNWQEEVAKLMIKNGFRRGRYNPFLYHHKGKGSKTFVHGDDFATVGCRESVAFLKKVLEGSMGLTRILNISKRVSIVPRGFLLCEECPSPAQ